VELRQIQTRVAVGEGRKLKGYAVRYNDRSTHYIAPGTKERFAPNAFAKTLGSGADVRALFEHKAENLLGRTSSGTLQLRSDDDGLSFDLSLPDTQLGRDVYELTKRGDIRGMSFGFQCTDDAFSKEYDDEDGEEGFGDGEQMCIVRTVRAANLLEISAVSEPCYETTSVLARSHVDANIEARAKAYALANLNPREIDARNQVRVRILAADLKYKL